MTNYTEEKPLLTLSNISLSYGDKLILRDINIQIKDLVVAGSTTGQVCTVVGKSGVGKSQLFNIIAGLNKPTTGDVLIGIDQKKVEVGQVGMVAQNYPLFKHRTVLNNLKLVEKDEKKIEFYLNEFNLITHRDKYPIQLSGGQRQRVAIIQQLLCSEHFILLDEPFSGLDPLATLKLCENIQKVANMDEMNTILISSHILEPSLAISDKVWVLGSEPIPTNVILDGPLPQKDGMISGATIRFVEDLAAQGLAWRSDIYTDPKFVEICSKIRNVFKFI